MLDRLAPVLKASKTKPPAKGLISADDEAYMAAVLGCTMGILRHPMTGLRPSGDPDVFFGGPRQQRKRMDEITRAVRWHRIAPAFGVGTTGVALDSQSLYDAWTYNRGEFWASNLVGKMVRQGAPARITRGLPLPEVKAEHEPPFVIASRHPNGAVAVATLGRTMPEKGYFFSEADVTLEVGDLRGPIGVFGYYRSLTLVFDKPVSGKRIWAQDLAGEEATDITNQVKIDGNRVILSGELIKTIGLAAAGKDDVSDPGLVMVIEPA